MQKAKVFLNVTETNFGKFPTLPNNQKVNRDTIVYYASKVTDKGKESIFFLIRHKDAKLLKDNNFDIQSILIPAGFYPAAISYKYNDTRLEINFI
jgi:hypothetical protein